LTNFAAKRINKNRNPLGQNLKGFFNIKRNMNIIGKTFGQLTILDYLEPRKIGSTFYKQVKVECSCGTQKQLTLKDILRGDTKSCGCLSKSIKKEVKEGDTFGFWTILKETEGYQYKGKKESRTVLCKCACGKEKNLILQSLIRGSSKSCGCQGVAKKVKEKETITSPKQTEEEQWKDCPSYKGYSISSMGRLYSHKNKVVLKDKITYDLSGYGKSLNPLEQMYIAFVGEFDSNTHKVFSKSGEKNLKDLILIENNQEKIVKLRTVYRSMKTRCTNTNNPDYPNYGGRGIKIEESFSTPEKFIEWSLDNGFELNKGLTIDRIDNNGNYSTDNCRWISGAENNRNRRDMKLDWNKVEEIRNSKLSSKELALKFNCDKTTIKNVRNFKTWVKE
jgi:hypothetical protein